MEKEKECDGVKEQIKRIVSPIFDSVLQETSSNSMTTTKKVFKILWRPNNYRRELRVKIKDNSAIKKIQNHYSPTIDTTQQFSFNLHTKMISIKNYKGVTLQYGKNTLTAIWSQNQIGGVKETFLIEAYNVDDFDKRIDMKKEEIRKRLDSALFSFAKQFGLRLRFEVPVWKRSENWIKGEEFIDSIPKEVVIHDTYFKKVYPKGVEFKSGAGEEPLASTKNYIKNRAIENVAPVIAEELAVTRADLKEELVVNRELIKGILEVNRSSSKMFSEFSKGTIPILQDFAVNIKTHNKVLKGIDKSFKKFNKILSAKDQTKLGDFG